MEDIIVTGDAGSFVAFVLAAIVVFGGIYAYKKYKGK